ncbi:MAG: hypothetical protein RIC55_04130 [Pirellulaceae bacterium]
MEEIRKQVSRAHRRLVLEQLLGVLPWTMFAALAVALLAIAVPKIWAIEALAQPTAAQWWTWSWIAGCAVVGLLSGVIWTWLARRGEMQAALELDRRYGLKERVSSALSLAEQDRESEFGRALLGDAERRVRGIDVREQFRLGVSWRALLPLLPAVIAFTLAVFVPYAVREQTTQATETQLITKAQTKKSINDLKKKLNESRKIAQEKGLEEAEAHLKELMKRLDKLDAEADKLDRKDALVKLNDLKKDLEQRREKLGNGDEMRKQMNRLKDVQRGPADRAANAMKNGDFKQAMNEIQQLQDKLRNGELNEQEQKDLANQLQQMQEKLQEAVDAHKKAKQELEEEIKKLQDKQNNGGLNDQEKQELQKRQQQLDDLKQQDEQMNRMQQMAQQLGECSKCLGEGGDPQQAADQLDQLAQQLGEMQQELDELETLDNVMEQIADAKNAMACEQCQGKGCQQCQGLGKMPGMGQGQGDQPGNGMGRGQGEGHRPEEATDTGEFLSKVAAKPGAGEAVRQGEAGGPNAPGVTRESVKAEIKAAMSRDVDPLTNERIPRDQRDHAREYFERYRTGK